MTWTLKGTSTYAARFPARGPTVIGTKLYAVGGTDSPPVGTHMQEWDQASNTWTQKADLPIGRYSAGGGAIGTKIYSVGGHRSNAPFQFQVMADLDEWDQATDAWVSKASLAVARAGGGCAIIGTKLYYTGGFPAAGGGSARHDEWDQASNTWTQKADLPVALQAVAAASIGTKLYCAGGLATGATTGVATLYEWDQASNTWTQKADMPVGLFNRVLIAVGTKLYALGGKQSTSGGSSPDVDIWDQATNIWTASSDDLAAGFDGHNGVAIAGTLYHHGRADGAGASQLYENTTIVDPPIVVGGWSVGTVRIA